MSIRTADLCDRYSEDLQICVPLLRHFGGRRAFGGEIATVKTAEDNSLVRAAVREAGRGRILVVDGEGSQRCALVGDVLGGMARDNGWAGVVVHGCIRDAAVLATIDLGVLALATHPLKGKQGAPGRRDVSVSFAGVTFQPGHFLYADQDGIVVAPSALAQTEGTAR